MQLATAAQQPRFEITQRLRPEGRKLHTLLRYQRLDLLAEFVGVAARGVSS